MRGGIRQGLHGGHSAREGTAERDLPQCRRSLPGYTLVQCAPLERHRFIYEHVAARRDGKKFLCAYINCIYVSKGYGYIHTQVLMQFRKEM